MSKHDKQGKQDSMQEQQNPPSSQEAAQEVTIQSMTLAPVVINPIQATPVERIMDLLVDVVEKGLPLTPMAALLQILMPADVAEATIFLEQMRRLKLAGERVFSMSQEIYVGKLQ
jgi:hypothetical protein